MLKSKRCLADVMGAADRAERAGALHNLLQAGPVHVFHDEKVKVLVLIDVVGADNIWMVQGCDSSSFAVKALQSGGIIRLRGRQDLHSGPAAHELVFTKKDAAHAPCADPFENLVITDSEAAPFTLEELLSLEMGDQSVPYQAFREIFGL